MFTKFFKTTTGVLQGDILSPTLFNLFLSDLPECLSHNGVNLDQLNVKYIMYADDLCLIAQDSKDLQVALNCLEQYCDMNKLVVNTTKSKLLIFHKGRLPKSENVYKNRVLERVNEFSYLGITLSSQMSFSSHLQNLVMKANSRIGLLFAKLDLQEMPIEVLKKVFVCYILPVFEYGLVIWISGGFSSSSEQTVNATFTKFWKRYLNLPLHSNNAIVYYLTDTIPLMSILRMISLQRTGALYLPDCMEGIQLRFLNNLTGADNTMGPDFILKDIPTYFWRSRALQKIPARRKFRRKLCREVCDTDHYELCKTAEFHNGFTPSCICKLCNNLLHPYHIAYTFCEAEFG